MLGFARSMTLAAVAVFVLSDALIAFRRLRILPIGRPAGALLGAVLTVTLGVPLVLWAT